MATRTAKRVAEYLLQSKIQVLASAEGDDMVDGEVQITPLISVQVSTDDDTVLVVIEHPGETDDDSEYEFWAGIRDLNRLVADVRRALAMYGSVQ